MDTIFRDPIWQFVGVIIGIVSISISIIIKRQKRELIYRIISKIPLAAKVENADEQLSIIFRRRRVSDVYLYIITIRNSGNQPIKKDDYETPITIRVLKPASILIGEILNTKPSSLSSEIIGINSNEYKRKIIAENPRTVLNELVIKPILLNPNDEFTLKIIVCDYQKGELVINGRVIGIKEINPAKESSKNILTAWIWLPALIGIFITYSFLISNNVILSTLGVIILVFALFWIVSDTVEDMKQIWKRISNK